VHRLFSWLSGWIEIWLCRKAAESTMRLLRKKTAPGRDRPALPSIPRRPGWPTIPFEPLATGKET
jgi:hypothetical protein